MNKYYYDLHIHTKLSPCADDLMTPNNILNMAMLKGLDFIAITDHNSTLQLDAIEKLKDSYDFIVVPGIEVTVKEKFDVLCYFDSFEKAKLFGLKIEKYLINEELNSDEYQIIYDEFDNESGNYNYSLKQTNISYDNLYKLVNKYSGIIIMAHIDRKNSSFLKKYNHNEIKYDGVELQLYSDNDEFVKRNNWIKEKVLLRNSDSHTIMTISERDNYIELSDKSIQSLFEYLRGNANE